tara:strand:+ start:142 stop:330 length:189 start_codon:yes stop_codon:yes gene_type:complete
MKEEDIKKIIQLRDYIIQEYKGLDGLDTPATAIIKQQQVAYTLKTIIKSIEDIVRPYVNFES